MIQKKKKAVKAVVHSDFLVMKVDLVLASKSFNESICKQEIVALIIENDDSNYYFIKNCVNIKSF